MVELTVVADLCSAFAELAERRPEAVAYTARKLSRILRHQAQQPKRAA